MNEDRELDRISQLFAEESAALRKRTLLLSAIPVVVGAVVVVSAYYGVADARARLAEIQELRDGLAAEVEALEARRLELEDEVEQQKAVATHFQEKLPQEEKQTANLIQSGLDAYNKGDWQAAVETLESAVRRDPGTPIAEVQYRLGISLWRTGAKDKALEHLQTAFKIDPSYEQRAREDPRLKSLWDYRELVAAPRKPAADQGATRYIAEALESARSGSFDKAADSYDKALEANPDTARVHGLKGFALYKQGDFDQAIASYERCLEIDPRSAECHFNLGLALWEKEDWKRAVSEFQAAFEIDPKWEAQARNNPVYRRIEKEIESRRQLRRPLRERKPGPGSG